MRGHVRKRGNKWCCVIDIGIDSVTGKRKQKWFSGFKTKKEAEKVMISRLNDLENGIFVKTPKITVKEFLEYWLKDYARGALRPTTFQTYNTLIQSHIIPSIGVIKLQQLKTTHLQQFYNKKLEDGRVDRGGGLSPQTIRYFHSILRRALGHAVKWQLLSCNVVELADPPSIRKKEILTFGAEEVKQFLLCAEADRMFMVFLLAVTTGLRRGELLGLRWNDIDMKARTASIRKNLVLVDNKPVLQEPKSKGSLRMVTLPKMAITALIKHKEKQTEEKLKIGYVYQDHDLIAATSIGTPINPRNLLRSFEKIIKKASLPKIRFHDLRHTHATLMLKQGEHPKIVSERLGHSDTRITMDIYSHVMPNMQRDAVDRFEKAFLSNTK